MEDVLLSPIRLSDFKALIEDAVHRGIAKYLDDPSQDEMMSASEAAKYIDLAKPTLYSLVCNKKIPYHKTGKKLRFSRQELIDWQKNK